MKKEMKAIVDAMTLMGSRMAVEEAIELAVEWVDAFEPKNAQMQAVKELIYGLEQMHEEGQIPTCGYDEIAGHLGCHDDWKHENTCCDE